MCLAEDVVDSKAARCLFDESLIRSMYDLEKLTELGRQTKIKLNVDPPPYGRCCYNRFDPVSLSLRHVISHRVDTMSGDASPLAFLLTLD